MYHAREAQRRLFLKTFPSDSPMHGKSYYDHLIIRLDEEVAYVEPGIDFDLEIEEIT